MSLTIAAIVMTLWLIGWLIGAAWATHTKSGDDLVNTIGILVIPFTITTCFLGFILTPGQQSIFDPTDKGLHNRDLWKCVHHLSIFCLMIFLSATQYLQYEGYLKSRRNSNTVVATYDRLWALTKIAPPGIALTVLLSGLRLIWQTPANSAMPGGGNSLSWGYLQLLIVLFALLFFDGVTSFTDIVTDMRDRARRGDRYPATVAGSSQLFLHFLSWPAIFLLALLHPRSTTFLSAPIEAAENRLRWLPYGWPDAVAGFLLWAVVGVTFLFLSRLVMFFVNKAAKRRRVAGVA